MENRSGIDCQIHSSDASCTMTEFKRMPAGKRRVHPLRLVWARTNWRSKLLQLIPLACLLVVGATVPGFLLTLSLLLLAVGASLAAFVFLVQMPTAYLVQCWRGRRSAAGSRRRSLLRRRPSSSGI